MHNYIQDLLGVNDGDITAIVLMDIVSSIWLVAADRS